MKYKIAYIVNSTIPSRTANSINVMKMCQAFKQCGFEVTLYIPAFDDSSLEEKYNFYGIRNKFNFECIDIRGRFKTELRFLYHAIKKAKQNKFDYIYIREHNALIWSSVFKQPAILELHGLPQRGRILRLVLLFHRL